VPFASLHKKPVPRAPGLVPAKLGTALVALGLLGSPGCAPSSLPAKTVDRSAHPQATQGSEGARAALELTADEVRTRDRIRSWTDDLSALGARDGAHPWELADAAEYLTRTFDALGVVPTRSVLEHDGVAFQTFSVEFPGETPLAPRFTVLVFYDSVLGPFEADDPAPESLRERGVLGTAVGLELAYLFRASRLERALRVMFVARPENMSSSFEWLEETKLEALGALVLGARLGAPEIALTNGSSLALGDEATSGAIATENALLHGLVEELGSEPLSFGSVTTRPRPSGFAASPSSAAARWLYARGTGNPVSFELAAVRTAKIRAFVGSVVGEMPTNDEMVTPLYGALR
jgi:hypothetical protein